MNKNIIASLLVLGLLSGLSAQTATDGNSGLTINHDSVLDKIFVDFWAKATFYYFIMETEDLASDPWAYFPHAVLGSDGVEGIDMDKSASQMFFKVIMTNDPASELLTSDFDGDFVLNKDELDLGLGIFKTENSEPDFLIDDWEIFHFGDLTRDGDGDADGDGILDKFEAQVGTDPNLNETLQSTVRSNFTYNALGRLTTTSGSVDLTFAFDDEGNLESAN